MAIEISALDPLPAAPRADTDWNVDGPMPWGHSCTDIDAGALRRLGAASAWQGCRPGAAACDRVDAGPPPH
ncbi:MULTISPECIES: hypothetical protein [Gammaproteobacteria]|uniref:Uncharacterized protein n=1 Tax=Xanthomonas boreopolis TaxID=86183 RepID=A0A919F8C9_9XANT|nr:hypothetical protein [Pseudomonas sp. Hp2]GHH54593.1 hypothetical protein GCM10009090_21770 [[Pseudomonas] boreopolis]